jgi:hypothetical protein
MVGKPSVSQAALSLLLLVLGALQIRSSARSLSAGAQAVGILLRHEKFKIEKV